MNLCDNGHEEVAYEGNSRTRCPVCELQKQLDDMTASRDELQDEVNNFDPQS